MTSITGFSTSQNDEITFVFGDIEKYRKMICEKLVNEYSQLAPVTKAVGATPEEIRQSYLEASENSLNSSFSILAFCNEKCIGWALNYISTDIKECFEDPNLSFTNDFTEKITNVGFDSRKANQIAAVIEEAERNFTFFIPNCKKLFILDILFVHPSFAGKGLAKKLTEKSIEIARKNHCDSIKATATNLKSSHIFSKFGFQCVREIQFDAFLENGKPFLRDFGDGNKSIRLMFLKLI